MSAPAGPAIIELSDLALGREIGRGSFGAAYAATWHGRAVCAKVRARAQDDAQGCPEIRLVLGRGALRAAALSFPESTCLFLSALMCLEPRTTLESIPGCVLGVRDLRAVVPTPFAGHERLD